MSAVAVGIDLGTTNSCVAVYKNGKVEILQNEHNSYTIPSWVSFTDDGILTGHEAKDQAHKHIQNTVFEVKRLMGQRYDDKKVQKDIERLPYEIIEDNGIIKIKVDYQEKKAELFPEEICAFILQNLKDLAQSRLNQEVTNVVVTIPAYFNELQRKATKDAATMAGFQKVNIINEPTAAALAFSYQNVKRYKRNILVYDFGGGTFDVSIMTIGRGECEVKATKGNLHLGGTDIDLNLANFIKKDFKEKFDEEVSESPADMRRLKNSCEKIKKRLSGGKLTEEIELIKFSGRDYLSSITRKEFEDLNADIFQETLSIVEDCLDDSELTKNEIDEVILVGGSSRIPKVQEMLKEYFGEDKINKGVNPDEAVAYGAAIHATNLVGNKCEVKDVISLSLGVAEFGFLSSVIIPHNTTIPTKFTKRYATFLDNQEEAKIVVFQGEALFVPQNFELGRFTLTGLRKAAAGQTKIDVTFEIDEEGILNVTASEVDSENQRCIEIDVQKKGLTAEQIQHRTEEIEEHRKSEVKRKEFLDSKYELEKVCNRIADNAKDFKDNDLKTTLLDKCNEISECLTNLCVKDKEELDEIKKGLENLYKSNQN